MDSEDDATLHNITKHCMWQVTNALAPGILHQTSLVAKVTTFCGELAGAANPKLKKKQGADTPLVHSLDVSKFVEGAITPSDFCKLLEEALLREEDGKLDNAALQGICFKYYSSEKKGEITFPEWFTSTCTFRLWMVFCVLVEDDFLTISMDSFKDVLKRLLELSGINWTDEPQRFNEKFDFPMFLKTITECFEKFKLDNSLTCEVIEDLHDEYVCGVLKKGYLVKKGHVRKNYKRRWFVLQRSIMSYYESRKNMEKKGELVLNGKTEVASIKDEGDKKYRFLVSCGETGKVFELSAEDHRSKQQWMTAVGKAIALAKVLEKDGDMTGIKEFYTIKYGTEEPRLCREDSELRRIRFLTNSRDKGPRISSTFIEVTTPPMPRTGSEDSTCSAGHIELLAEEEDGEEDDDGEEYLTMEPLRSEHSTVEDDDDLELYVPMEAAPSAAASLLATPRDVSSQGPAAMPPQRPVSNIDIVTSSDSGVHLLTDERGYTYLDTNLITELLNQTGREGQRVGSGDPSVAEELYMDPNLMTSSGPYGGEHGKGEGPPGGPTAPGDDDDDDAYDEPRLVLSSPSQTAGVLVQRAVPGGDPRTPLASEGNMYVDARLLSAQLDRLGDEKQGEGPGDLDRYDSWNIVADSKASGLIPPRGPVTSTEKYHPNIKMLSLDDCDRDSSSPEDMEQWKMPTGDIKQKTSFKKQSAMDEALKSPLLKSNQPAKTNGVDGAGEEGNYNYVSWELVNQPSADDSSRKAVSLDLSSPNSESPNSYLKLSYMSAPPTSSETSSGTQMQSPQTGAAKDAPPIPSRGRRTSKNDLTSSDDPAPPPPPRMANTSGGARKKPVPNPRLTVSSQLIEHS